MQDTGQIFPLISARAGFHDFLYQTEHVWILSRLMRLPVLLAWFHVGCSAQELEALLAETSGTELTPLIEYI